jgi:uncharacterized small protein (DUF1192 family)
MAGDVELVINDKPEWSPDEDDWYERARLAEARLAGSRDRVAELKAEVAMLRAEIARLKGE